MGNARVTPDGYFLDYGWLENEQGEQVWKGTLEGCLNGGVHLFIDRINIDFLDLEKGKYTLVYSKSDIPDPYQGTPSEYLFTLPTWQGIKIIASNDTIKTALNKLIVEHKQKGGLLIDSFSRIYQDAEGQIW